MFGNSKALRQITGRMPRHCSHYAATTINISLNVRNTNIYGAAALHTNPQRNVANLSPDVYPALPIYFHDVDQTPK